MNQGNILSPSSKAYTSKDYFNADVISEKVRAGATSAGVLAKTYTNQAVLFVKANPSRTLLAVASVGVLWAVYFYRSQLMAQVRKFT